MQEEERPWSSAAEDLVIGGGTHMVGKVRCAEGVQVHGVLEGELNAGHVLVGESGRVTGSLTADGADVHGEVSHDVRIRGHVILRSTARFTGKLSYLSISIESGARLSGSLSVMQSGLAAEPPSPSEAYSSSGASPHVLLRLCSDKGRREGC
jgi:cytoskeletal protein CcmA (bactofilin family)